MQLSSATNRITFYSLNKLNVGGCNVNLFSYRSLSILFHANDFNSLFVINCITVCDKSSEKKVNKDKIIKSNVCYIANFMIYKSFFVVRFCPRLSTRIQQLVVTLFIAHNKRYKA